MLTRRALLQVAATFGITTEHWTSAGMSPGAAGTSACATKRLFEKINEIRVVNGAGELRWSAPVAACAVQQSLRKVELRFAGHEDPERGDVAQRLRSAGIGWSHCGENLFMERGWDDPVNYAAVFWWYSPGHQANLLNPDYTETGVGLAQGEDGAWFVTQIFVTPPPVPPAISGQRRAKGPSL